MQLKYFSTKRNKHKIGQSVNKQNRKIKEKKSMKPDTDSLGKKNQQN